MTLRVNTIADALIDFSTGDCTVGFVFTQNVTDADRYIIIVVCFHFIAQPRGVDFFISFSISNVTVRVNYFTDRMCGNYRDKT